MIAGFLGVWACDGRMPRFCEMYHGAQLGGACHVKIVTTGAMNCICEGYDDACWCFGDVFMKRFPVSRFRWLFELCNVCYLVAICISL